LEGCGHCARKVTRKSSLMWQSPASEVQNGRVRYYTISVFEVQANTSSIYVGEVSEDPLCSCLWNIFTHTMTMCVLWLLLPLDLGHTQHHCMSGLLRMVSILTFALRSLHSYCLLVYHYTVFIIRKQFFTLAVESNFAMPAESITFPLCIAPSGPPRGVSAFASDLRTIEISWSQPLPVEHLWHYIELHSEHEHDRNRAVYSE